MVRTTNLRERPGDAEDVRAYLRRWLYLSVYLFAFGVYSFVVGGISIMIMMAAHGDVDMIQQGR